MSTTTELITEVKTVTGSVLGNGAFHQPKYEGANHDDI
jgi:hypothetical protein